MALSCEMVMERSTQVSHVSQYAHRVIETTEFVGSNPAGGSFEFGVGQFNQIGHRGFAFGTSSCSCFVAK